MVDGSVVVVVATVVVLAVVVLVVVLVAATVTVVCASVVEVVEVAVGSVVIAVADKSVVAAKSVLASSVRVVVSVEESAASPLDASTKLFCPCCTNAYRSRATLSIEDGYSVVGLSVVVEAVFAETPAEGSTSSDSCFLSDCVSLSLLCSTAGDLSIFPSSFSSSSSDDSPLPGSISICNKERRKGWFGGVFARDWIYM